MDSANLAQDCNYSNVDDEIKVGSFTGRDSMSRIQHWRVVTDSKFHFTQWF